MENKLNIKEYFNVMQIKRIALSSTIMAIFINAQQMIFYRRKGKACLILMGLSPTIRYMKKE